MYRPLFPYLYYLDKECCELSEMLPFKCRMVVPNLLSLEYGEDPPAVITVLLLSWLMTETLTHWTTKTHLNFIVSEDMHSFDGSREGKN